MIELRKIDEDNWHDIVNLDVHEKQKGFVAPNMYSLAESYVELLEWDIPPMTFAVYSDDSPVGFAKIEYEADGDDETYDAPHYWMSRFMIDKSHQGKGFGKQAMEKILELVKTLPQGPADAMCLSYKPDNDFVRGFYKSFGFVETGKIFYGEVVAKLVL